MKITSVLWGILALLLILLIIMERRREKNGFPDGKIVYEDLSGAQKPRKVLFSETYDLCGKPDLILEQNGVLIPVEIKNMVQNDLYAASHRMQLLAYCLLIEETYHLAPPYGLLRYRDQMIEIRYDRKAKKELLKTIEAIRKGKVKKKSGLQCSLCGYRSICR